MLAAKNLLRRFHLETHPGRRLRRAYRDISPLRPEAARCLGTGEAGSMTKHTSNFKAEDHRRRPRIANASDSARHKHVTGTWPS